MNRLWLLGALVGSAAAGPSDKCKKDVADLRGYIKEVAAENGFSILGADGVKLVERAGLPAAPHETTVALTPKELVLGFTHRVAKADYAKAFAVERSMQDDPGWAKVTPGLAGHPHELTWLIDEATPWGDVVAALEAARSHGFDHVQLVFSTKAMAASSHTAVDDAVAHATQGISLALQPFTKSFADKCPGIIKAFYPPSGDDWVENTFSPALRAGLEACDCALPMDELRSFLYYTFVPHPKTGAVAVVLAHTGTVISAPRAATWKSVAPKLTGGTLKLTAK